MSDLTKAIKNNQPVLKTSTLREFSGGLNVLDDDLNLDTKFAKRLANVYYAPDQSIKVRQGVKLFVNLSKFTSSPNVSVVNITYYNQALIAVMSNGEILRILADSTVTRIWDNSTAAALPGAPTGWSTTAFASFEEFNNQLIVCNGVNKPLLITSTFVIGFLQDLGSNSNLNTPIAKYVTSCSGYLVFSGDLVHPTRVHISARYTSGTFYGDPAPNDATYVDVGSSLRNSSIIKGIRTFRDKLIVSFTEGTIVGTLGTYNSAGTVHTPTFDDTMELYGSISHRSMLPYGDDMLMMDSIGVPSLVRTVLTGTIRPQRTSDLIDNESATYINALSGLTQENGCFGVFDQKEGQFMFFIPNNDNAALVTETKAYVYLYRPQLKLNAWARFDGWNFTCGVRSGQGRLFFGDGKGKLWLMGNDQDPVYSDYLHDDTVNNGQGVPITFDWELPWTDFGRRTKTKRSKYITLDTRGTGRFTVSMYCDRYITDANGADAPQLSMLMTGGDALGYGGPTHPFGGGRSTRQERLYAWPAKFQIAKLRFRGSTTTHLSFVSISMLYQEGLYSR